MPGPQFALRALLILALEVACFFGGIRFEREWRRSAQDKEEQLIGVAVPKLIGVAVPKPESQ
jgi:hypothetical protein